MWGLWALPILLAAPAEPTWVFKPFISTAGLQFGVSGPAGERTLEPNSPLNLGLSASYKGLGASLSVAVDSVESEAGLEQTDALDLSLYWHGEQWAVDLFVQRYTGLFERSEEDADCAQVPCRLWPKGRLQRLGATIAYSLDPAYALKAAYGQSGTQTESAGSWVLMAGADAATAELPADGALPARSTTLAGLFAGGGYGHRWVAASGWFGAASLLVGLGPAWLEDDGGAAPEGTQVGLKANLKLSGGYDVGGWFTGLVAFGDRIQQLSDDEDREQVSWMSLYVELFFGLRY